MRSNEFTLQALWWKLSVTHIYTVYMELEGYGVVFVLDNKWQNVRGFISFFCVPDMNWDIIEKLGTKKTQIKSGETPNILNVTDW